MRGRGVRQQGFDDVVAWMAPRHFSSQTLLGDSLVSLAERQATLKRSKFPGTVLGYSDISSASETRRFDSKMTAPECGNGHTLNELGSSIHLSRSEFDCSSLTFGSVTPRLEQIGPTTVGYVDVPYRSSECPQYERKRREKRKDNMGSFDKVPTGVEEQEVVVTGENGSAGLGEDGYLRATSLRKAENADKTFTVRSTQEPLFVSTLRFIKGRDLGSKHGENGTGRAVGLQQNGDRIVSKFVEEAAASRTWDIVLLVVEPVWMLRPEDNKKVATLQSADYGIRRSASIETQRPALLGVAKSMNLASRLVCPGVNFPYPAATTTPQLALRCHPAIKPFLPDDLVDNSSSLIIVDALLRDQEIAGSQSLIMPVSSSSSPEPELFVNEWIDGMPLASGTVPLNRSATIPFSLSKISPRSEPYSLVCTATLSSPEQNFMSILTSLTYLPSPPHHIGSITKLDLRTGGLLAKRAGTQDPYESVFPVGFYTPFGAI
ncbi:hypothetical protein EI94DRAFT_1788592 [Lactarius quietus]|nr:hypothetical protein EI94DRAFT_1788592 [Lactarius quietus]